MALPQRIETARLSLPARRVDDASAIFRAYAQDPEVCRFMVWTPHSSEAAAQAFIRSCMEELCGQGFTPEAIGGLTMAALARSGFFRVQATCDVENVPSQRALEKAAFLREGRLERYTVHPNISPEPRACFMYAKCR